MNVVPDHRDSSCLLENALHRPVRDFVGRQGKRIRASLMQISYRIGGGGDEIPREVAESIEWLHAGSLVIDDIQDGSDDRRGNPTMHRQIGVPLAINAGNYMYFRALQTLTKSSIDATRRCQLVDAMIDAGRVCHEGQAMDIAASIDQHPPQQWGRIAEQITRQKTATLVALAMKMGAIVAGGNSPLISQLERCGKQIGFALQMRNDLEELVQFSSGQTDRCDDLRRRRVAWPWGWLADLRGHRHCQALAIRLAEVTQSHEATKPHDHGTPWQHDPRMIVDDDLSAVTVDSLREIASNIAAAVADFGSREILDRVDHSVHLLGELTHGDQHVSELVECLRPIAGSMQPTLEVAS